MTTTAIAVNAITNEIHNSADDSRVALSGFLRMDISLPNFDPEPKAASKSLRVYQPDRSTWHAERYESDAPACAFRRKEGTDSDGTRAALPIDLGQ